MHISIPVRWLPASLELSAVRHERLRLIARLNQDRYVLFDREELERCVGEFLGIKRRESQMVLREIESQHGLLVERAEKVLSFSHLTFHWSLELALIL